MMTKFKDLKSTQLENIAFDIHCIRTDISHFITSVLLQKNLYHRIAWGVGGSIILNYTMSNSK